MITKYVCHYKTPFHYDYAEVVSTNGLSDFKDGFWINSKQELTKGSDAWVWIPPSAVVWVEKVEE